MKSISPLDIAGAQGTGKAQKPHPALPDGEPFTHLPPKSLSFSAKAENPDSTD